MAYPSNQPLDLERSHEMGGRIEKPAVPTVASLDTNRVQGGAPKLTDSQLATPTTLGPDPGFMTPKPSGPPPKDYLEEPASGPGGYWNRVSLPDAPTRHTLYPASPWDRKEVEKEYAPAIAELGDRLWNTYQNLPAEQKALPAWQQVAKNPQEAAQSIITRSLINAAGIRSELKPDSASTIRGRELYRWLNVLGGK